MLVVTPNIHKIQLGFRARAQYLVVWGFNAVSLDAAICAGNRTEAFDHTIRSRRQILLLWFMIRSLGKVSSAAIADACGRGNTGKVKPMHFQLSMY